MRKLLIDMTIALNSDTEKDQAEIDKLTSRFFSLFTNTDGQSPNVRDIKEIFIDQGVIISNTGGDPIIYDLDGFIQPREEMLTNGTLLEFSEHETSQKTDVFGNIAQRWSTYEKSGKLNGVYFKSYGRKTIQFVRKNEEWKISSVAWSDDV